MNDYHLITLRSHPRLLEEAANWFHAKWDIPLEAYRDSMTDCIQNASPVPQWYLAMCQGEILGGLGVIENDFHDRKDLTPNICAVYVEEEHRCQGIAGALLQYVCTDMAAFGIDTLYLLTDHTDFYERYGWEFFCMVQGDGESEMSRMYIHRPSERR